MRYNAFQTVHARAGQAHELVVILKPGGAVRGTVVAQEGGAPVPAAQIMTPSDMNAIADADGKFMIEGLNPEKHMLTVVADGMARRALEISVELNAIEQIEVSLAPGYCVRGTIRDEAGKPIPAVSVTAPSNYGGLDNALAHYYRSYGGRWALSRTETDDQGGYVLRGFAVGQPVGDITVQHNEYATQMRTNIGPPAAGDDATIVDFVLDRGCAIMGKITGPDGGPVVTARVTFRDGPAGAQTTTDANGEFSLDNIDGANPGHVLVQCEGLAPVAVSATPGKDETRPWLDIVMEPGHTAKGTVIDHNGDPVARARLTPYARFADDGPRTFMAHISQAGGTASDGTFLLSSLPAEGVTVTVRIDGYKPIEAYPLNVDDITTIIMQKQ